MGFNKASSYTFSKPLDAKFVREASLVTLGVHGVARPECLWPKAGFYVPVVLPLIAEVYLRSFSKSLKRHPTACRGGAGEPFLA